MAFLQETFGEYPYEKIAHVQSRTRFGGMENAGNIFYNEGSVSGSPPFSLIAHELGHQWFGNSATEVLSCLVLSCVVLGCLILFCLMFSGVV
jgi:aminopeptidase N